jgi:hypothetical protein
VNETIQDGITDSGIREPGMPLSHRHLGGDHSGGSTIAIIQDFKQVLRLRTGQGITEPVIEDQELGAGEGVEEFGVGAVGVGKGDVVEEPRSAEVANGEVVAADRVREGTGEESLADAGGTKDEDVEMLIDPIALSQVEDKAALEAARSGKVEVFDGCW